jgi:rhodanese-related sulfurtransferase
MIIALANKYQRDIIAIANTIIKPAKETAMSKEITRQALAEALLSETPPIVFEALDRMYFDSGHLPGARVLPPSEIDKLVPAQVAEKDAPIVVYCSSDTCMNSHQAAARLTARGYSNVAVYVGGKKDWKEAGLKLEK